MEVNNKDLLYFEKYSDNDSEFDYEKDSLHNLFDLYHEEQRERLFNK